MVVGGGFGGLEVAKGLGGSDVDVLLLDRTNHHLFQPLLYQVATAALSPGDIARPLRGILRRYQNVAVRMVEVTSFDVPAKQIRLSDGEVLDYDVLVIAIGARHSYFGKDVWQTDAPGLKTLGDALSIRDRILRSFERAEVLASRGETEAARPDLTFVVVGGGPTGVELAGAIAEIAHRTMLRNFRAIDPTKTKVLLVEASDRLLSAFPEPLGDKAREQLEELGVEVWVGAKVEDIDSSSVVVRSSESHESHESPASSKSLESPEQPGGESSAARPWTGSREAGFVRIATRNCFWAAGNQAPKLLRSLPGELDSHGRVEVTAWLTLPAHDDVFVLGDCALARDEGGAPLPGVAPVAVQAGRYVAREIERRARAGLLERARDEPGDPTSRPLVDVTPLPRPFRYKDRGTMATVGKARAVASMGRLRFSGFPAWLAWSGVHILFLIGFRNRLRVAIEWLGYYITGGRSARLLYDPPDDDQRTT